MDMYSGTCKAETVGGQDRLPTFAGPIHRILLFLFAFLVLLFLEENIVVWYDTRSTISQLPGKEMKK